MKGKSPDSFWPHSQAVSKYPQNLLKTCWVTYSLILWPCAESLLFSKCCHFWKYPGPGSLLARPRKKRLLWDLTLCFANWELSFLVGEWKAQEDNSGTWKEVEAHLREPVNNWPRWFLLLFCLTLVDVVSLAFLVVFWIVLLKFLMVLLIVYFWKCILFRNFIFTSCLVEFFFNVPFCTANSP